VSPVNSDRGGEKPPSENSKVDNAKTVDKFNEKNIHIQSINQKKGTQRKTKTAKFCPQNRCTEIHKIHDWDNLNAWMCKPLLYFHPINGDLSYSSFVIYNGEPRFVEVRDSEPAIDVVLL